jgi:hypothetical protein
MGKGFIIKKKANNTPEIELTRIVVTEIHPNLKKAQSPKSSLAKEDNVLFSEHSFYRNDTGSTTIFL